MKAQVQDSFQLKYYKQAEVLVQAPTRINIIGEHTDYNDGLVLPAAINHYIYFAVAQTNSSLVVIYDENKDKQFSFDLAEDLPLEGLSQWRRYYFGAIKILQESYDIAGFQAYKIGKAPIGAGISSSAALCCGFIYALAQLFELNIDQWTIAKMAQRVEQEYVGLQCGIMDQFAVLFGEKDKVLALNCFDLSFDTHAIDLNQHSFLLCNSMVKHNLADSAYNERVNEMNRGKGILGLANLVKLRIEDAAALPKEIKPRFIHVSAENQRVLDMIQALQANDYKSAGKLLTASHDSLKNNYAVTCAETDYLVEKFIEAGALGARQMGGGFGGCVLVLVGNEILDELKSTVMKSYRERFDLDLSFYNFEIADGVKELT